MLVSNRRTFRNGDMVMRVVEDKVFIQTDNDSQRPVVVYLSREELLAALTMLDSLQRSEFTPFYTPKAP